MRRLVQITLLASFINLGLSCTSSYHTQALQYKGYRVESSIPPSSTMLALIKPYSDSVNKSMNDIVGFADQTLEKKHPSGSLGHFMADAMLTMASQKFNTKADIAFMNFGGIRLTQLPAGNITRSKIYELMPFDNILVLQKMKGSVLQQFLDLIAAKGGWPIAGMTMQIKDKKAVNVLIGGKPLDPEVVYTTVNSDFVANGGDNADMLRSLPRENIGYLVRDALLDYISWLKSQGKNITANDEMRVTNAQ